MLPTGNMKYSPEFFYIGAGFTGAFLLRVSTFSVCHSIYSSLIRTCVQLLHPSLAETIDRNKRMKIYHVAQKLIDSLSSEVVAIDEEHTPKQYSIFLQELMGTMMTLWEQRGGVSAASSSAGANGGRKSKHKSGMMEARVQEVAC